MATRRPRRALVVVVGNPRNGDRHAHALTETLGEIGVETRYLGRLDDAIQIAAMVDEHDADAVELCLAAPGGVSLLRSLLRALTQKGRRDVSIVVHRLV